MKLIIAVFLWNKSKINSISTMIYENESLKILSAPKRQYFSAGYFKFRSEVKKNIKNFFSEIIYYHKKYKIPVYIEYKIIFIVPHLPYYTPAKESIYTYKIFFYWLKQTKKKINKLKISTQLRNKLTGKSLILFNRNLRLLNLVSRKTNTRYEYYLWQIALHATKDNYQEKINLIKSKLLTAFWNEDYK